jgi:hypothetical protein
MNRVPVLTFSENDKLLQSIRRAGWVISAVGVLTIAVMWGFEMAVYFLLGALLSTLNSWWLQAALDGLLRLAPRDARSRGLRRFFLRLGLIMICLYVTIRASFMGALACVGGLSVHILGAMAVGVRLAFRTVGIAPRASH